MSSKVLNNLQWLGVGIQFLTFSQIHLLRPAVGLGPGTQPSGRWCWAESEREGRSLVQCVSESISEPSGNKCLLALSLCYSSTQQHVQG